MSFARQSALASPRAKPAAPATPAPKERPRGPIGNQAALRQLSRAPPRLQTKLEIGAVDDPLEREADEVADKVMRMPDPAVPVSAGPPQISRKCAACEKGDEEKQKVQMKPAGGARPVGEAPPIVHEVLGEPGQPLDTQTRAFFEPRFGQDFSRVRIHDGPNAGRASLALQARAFTAGSHLVFARGEFRPDLSGYGGRLLAHELAHTMQQRGSGQPANVIRRTEFKDCTDKQLADMVNPAKDQALSDLDDVIAALGARPLAPTTAGALFLAFRAQDEATADAVKAVLEKIRAGLNSDTIYCDQPKTGQPGLLGKVEEALTPEAFECVKGRLGYTSPLFNMHLCMNAWPNVSGVLRSQNLIHEGAHAYDKQVGDPGYFDYNTCAETASSENLRAPQRLGTPDAYSCFVHYMKYDRGVPARAESI